MRIPDFRKSMILISFSILFSLLILQCHSIASVLVDLIQLEPPSFQFVQRDYRPSDLLILDKSGNELGSIRLHSETRSLEWFKWKDVSPGFQKMLIRAEDKRFNEHIGVDLIAVAHSLLQNTGGTLRRGASTISMQLANLLNSEHSLGHRGLLQKIKQMYTALKLERHWTKSEILEAYINLVAFRGELKGLNAASENYFGKDPSSLTLEESAFLVSLIRAPNASIGTVRNRYCRLLSQIEHKNALFSEATPTLASTCDFDESKIQALMKAPSKIRRERSVLPVLSSKIIFKNPDDTLKQTAPSQIITTVDKKLQILAIEALREQIAVLRDRNVHDGAILILANQTGTALAYAANGGPEFSSAAQIDGILMKRQAGSTIKPFIYGTAFELKLLNENSLLSDSPADISVADGKVYHPKNYDNTFHGFVSAAEALGSSLNVPAVRVLQLTGVKAALDTLSNFGFQNLPPEDFFGPSLALGAIDVSLWDLTQAYRRLNWDSVFSKGTRLQISSALSLPEYRRFTFGIQSLLSLPFYSAVKTGTSKDMRDNWCIGWNNLYTIGVWIGNFDGTPMWNVSGISGAAPIWRKLMLYLGSSATNLPSAVKYENYRTPALPLMNRSLSYIKYPVKNMKIGLDPDIPKNQQKLPIEIENSNASQKLYLNNKLLTQNSKLKFITVHRGKFNLILKSEEGRIIDAVNFEVR